MNMFTMKKYKLLCTDCLNVLYTFFILKTQTLKSDSDSSVEKVISKRCHIGSQSWVGISR